jgi:hypothetical protein
LRDEDGAGRNYDTAVGFERMAQGLNVEEILFPGRLLLQYTHQHDLNLFGKKSPDH